MKTNVAESSKKFEVAIEQLHQREIQEKERYEMIHQGQINSLEQKYKNEV